MTRRSFEEWILLKVSNKKVFKKTTQTEFQCYLVSTTLESNKHGATWILKEAFGLAWRIKNSELG